MLANQTAKKDKLTQGSQTTSEHKIAILKAKLQEQTQMVVCLEDSNRQLLMEISSLERQIAHISETGSNLRRGAVELEEALEFANAEVVKVMQMVSPTTPV
jgi:chromosome segregation ATPase